MTNHYQNYPHNPNVNPISRQDMAPGIGAVALGGNTQGGTGQYGEGSAQHAAENLVKLGLENVNNKSKYIFGDMTAPRTSPDGSSSEHLMGIVFAGDSALAVVATNRPGNSIHQIDIVKMGLGASNPSGELSTGKVVASVSMDTLRKPRENGAIKGWEDFTVGRRFGDVQPAIGLDGVEASRQHGDFVVTNEGNVEYKDHSKFGSVLVTDRNLNQAVLDPAVSQILNQSEMWSPTVAAQMPAVRIINPQ